MTPRSKSVARARPLRRLILLGILSLVLVPHAVRAKEHAGPKVRVPPEDLQGDEARAVALYRDALPTVVTILSTRTVTTHRGENEEQGLGSGVVISDDGLVLTASHAIENADDISVKTSDGDIHDAQIVFTEDSADIALIKIRHPPGDLRHAPLGDSDRLAVGQLTYVVGAPFGLEHSFSVGHISGFREFDKLYDGTILAEFIQTDAAINSGNSGGPVFDSKGRVIGIASRILSQSGGSEGLGFVVAINTAKQLLALEDRAWMGIEAIYLGGEALARLMNLDYSGGLLVQHVSKGSPADKAGLRGGIVPAKILGQELLLGGDLILEFNHQEACHSECLVREHEMMRGVDLVPVKFLRDGTIQQVVIDVSKTRHNFLKRAQ